MEPFDNSNSKSSNSNQVKPNTKIINTKSDKFKKSKNDIVTNRRNVNNNNKKKTKTKKLKTRKQSGEDRKSVNIITSSNGIGKIIKKQKESLTETVKTFRKRFIDKKHYYNKLCFLKKKRIC